MCNKGYTSLWATGGPCYPAGEGSFEYCGRGTYSATGYSPCQKCSTNTYANICKK